MASRSWTYAVLPTTWLRATDALFPVHGSSVREVVPWLPETHPSLHLRKAEATSLNRVTGLNRPAVKKFYDNIEQALAATGAGPERIFNADETGVTKPRRIICDVGRKYVGKVTSGERGQTVTVLLSMSATGIFPPPHDHL